jgi:ketosteroid isomerase-like protein
MTVSQDKVNELWAIWNSHSASKFLDHCADDITMQDAITPATKGKAAVKPLVEAWFKAFPDMTYTPTTQVVSGDTVVALYVASGTFKAPLVTPDGTIPATNKRAGWTGCVVMTFNAQGKLRSGIDVYDPGSFAYQLGIELPS